MQCNTGAEYGCTFEGDSGVQIVIIQAESSEIAADTLQGNPQEGRGK
jgi:hypothetical protein